MGESAEANGGYERYLFKSKLRSGICRMVKQRAWRTLPPQQDNYITGNNYFFKNHLPSLEIVLRACRKWRNIHLRKSIKSVYEQWKSVAFKPQPAPSSGPAPCYGYFILSHLLLCGVDKKMSFPSHSSQSRAIISPQQRQATSFSHTLSPML